MWRRALGGWLLALALALAAADDCAAEQLAQLLRRRFEQRFAERCAPLPLVREHFARRPAANATAARGASFVFFDAAGGHQRRLGGLGDRLAGLVSVFFWSLRQRRALLIEDPQRVAAELFAPLPPAGRLDAAVDDDAADDDAVADGERCRRAARPASFFERRRRRRPVGGPVAATAPRDARDVFCVNPRPRDAGCALETDADAAVAWLRVRLNRAYLCRWLATPSAAQRQLLALRRGAERVDLALWSGCALRLLLWPRPALWRRLATLLRRHTSTLWAAEAAAEAATVTQLVARHGDAVEAVALHFRCGDHRFDELRAASAPDAQFRRCASHGANGSFAGAAPLGEWASASPGDVAACAVGLDAPRAAEATAPLRVYVVASDAEDAAREMARELRRLHAAARPRQDALLVALPRGAHLDGAAARGAAQETLATWTLLALCDALAVQAVDRGDEVPPAASVASAAPSMVSAFSRSALWFGLGGAAGGAVGDGVVFATRRGSRCLRVAPPAANATAAAAFGLRSQGNWRCDAP